MANQKASPPVFLLAFANDARASLGLGSEQNAIWNELRRLDEKGVIQCQPISATLEQFSIEFSQFNDRIYIFHYGGHSDSEFLHLLDISSHAENFGVQIGQQKNLKLVFLNGCRNYKQVEILHQLGVPVAIATTTEIKDQPAISLAQIFYRALAGGSTIGESFERAKAHLFEKHPELKEAYRGIGLPWNSGSSWGIYPIRDSALNWSIHDIETESRLELMFQLREASKARHQKFIAPGGRFHHLHIDDAILTGIQDARRRTDGLIENNIAFEGNPTPLFQSMTTLWEKPCPHAMLVGPGGMGKTVSLLRLWEHLANAEDAETPVPIFIQLNEFNNEPIADFIQKYIRKHYADVELDELLKAEGQNHPSIVLLLDGINEVTTQRNELLLEINRLKVRENYPGLQLILTSRVDMRDSHQWQDFHLLELLPLTDEQISTYLEGKMPSEPRLLELLRNPMMLSIYAAQSGLQEQYRPKGLLKEHVTSTGELLFNVEAMQRIKIEEQYATNLPEQAFRRFVLEHLLPFIGWEMQQAGQFFIQKKSETEGLPGLEDLLQAGFKRLLTDTFFDTFEFFGEHLEEERFGEKPRQLFSEIIHQIAVQNLVVLVRDGENYRFLHQNFRDYFAARHVQNQIRLALHQKTFPEEMVKAPLDFYVRHLLGELEGEHTNQIGYNEERGWHWSAGQFFLENNLASLLDNCRGVFDRERLGYTVWNILTILKEQRGEFSGADLRYLDFNHFSFNFLGTSRPELPTTFSGGSIDGKKFFPQGHSNTVNSATFSCDGSRILTASDDQTAKVWNPLSGQCILSLQGHSSRIKKAAFSFDSTRIITASEDKTAKFWDAFLGKCILTLKGHLKQLNSATFSPDGSRIITASDDETAKVWNAETGKCILTLEGHSRSVNSAIFSPDGSKVITASDDETAKVWNAFSGKCFLTLQDHLKNINYAEFSPCGEKIITASDDHTARVWETETGECIFILEGHSRSVKSAAFSLDGSKIITASDDHTAKVWDAKSGQCILSLHDPLTMISSASFSPDGGKIITTSYDEPIKVWDINSSQCILSLYGNSGRVSSAAVSPNGEKIITASDDHTARVWDANTSLCILSLHGHLNSVNKAAFSPDGHRIITASDDKTAKLWDTFSGRCTYTFKGHSHWVTSANFSPNGCHIVTASYDQKAMIWNIHTRLSTFSIYNRLGYLMDVVFSPDGDQIITASYDQKVSIWDVKTKENILTFEGHSAPVSSVTFNLKGDKIITASFDHSAKVWDAKSGRCVLTLKGHPSWIWNAGFSPNGSKLITSSSDQTVKTWDAITGLCLLTLQGHSSVVRSAVFSPDGTKIITASYDGTCRIWNAQTGACIKILPNIPGLHIQGCDFRNLHPDSKLSEENIAIMRQYGGIFNDEDARQWEALMERHFALKPKREK